MARVVQRNMHLIQILLPLHDNEGRAFSVNHFTQVRRDLTDRFGGVTAFVRAPAVGLWKESADDINHDQVVMFEVLAAARPKLVVTLSQTIAE